MVNILIVEDDKSISNLIDVNLTAEGYYCTVANDGKTGADLLESIKYDLALLDIMLPGFDGYELLEYAKDLKCPVIFITAKGTVEDRIKGLKLGADDYIVKPFQIGELIARVEAVLRRLGKEEREIAILDVVIDPNSHKVVQNGKNVDLTMKEFELLLEFVKNKNIALYRDRLYEKVWGEEFTGETRTLDSHVQRLRKKLNWNDKIKTVFRIGYRLEV